MPAINLWQFTSERYTTAFVLGKIYNRILDVIYRKTKNIRSLTIKGKLL